MTELNKSFMELEERLKAKYKNRWKTKHTIKKREVDQGWSKIINLFRDNQLEIEKVMEKFQEILNICKFVNKKWIENNGKWCEKNDLEKNKHFEKSKKR